MSVLLKRMRLLVTITQAEIKTSLKGQPFSRQFHIHYFLKTQIFFIIVNFCHPRKSSGKGQKSKILPIGFTKNAPCDFYNSVFLFAPVCVCKRESPKITAAMGKKRKSGSRLQQKNQHTRLESRCRFKRQREIKTKFKIGLDTYYYFCLYQIALCIMVS